MKRLILFINLWAVFSVAALNSQNISPLTALGEEAFRAKKYKTAVEYFLKLLRKAMLRRNIVSVSAIFSKRGYGVIIRKRHIGVKKLLKKVSHRHNIFSEPVITREKG